MPGLLVEALLGVQFCTTETGDETNALVDSLPAHIVVGWSDLLGAESS
jgi:hypothetical protein